MRIFENGTYRDATPEELAAAAEVEEPEEAQSLEQRIAELEQELAATRILLGVSE